MAALITPVAEAQASKPERNLITDQVTSSIACFNSTSCQLQLPHLGVNFKMILNWKKTCSLGILRRSGLMTDQ